MPYMQRRPFINESDYLMDGEVPQYRRPFSNPGSLLLIFLLLLVAGWVLFGNNRSLRDFGINWGSGSDQIAIIGAPEGDLQAEAAPQVVYRERPVTAPARPTRRAEVAPTPKPVTRPAAREAVRQPSARTKNPNIVGYSWISAPRVNMRTGPGAQYELVSVLNENQMVAIFDTFELDEAGEVWSKISIETKGVTQEGWVNRSYLSY